MTRLIKFPFELVVDHLCTTYGFLKHIDTNFIYLYIYIPKTKKFDCPGRGDLTSVPREDAAGLMISARYLPSSYVEVPMAEQIGLVGTLVLCTLGNP